MKRLAAFVTCLVLVLLCGMAGAVEAKPGEEVTVKVNVEASDAVVATVGFSIPDGLEFVKASATSATIAMPHKDGKFGILATNPAIVNGQVNDGVNYAIASVPAGELGTITFKVKDGAAAGTYEIIPKVEARSMNGAANLVVTVETVEVKGDEAGLLGDVNGDGVVDLDDAFDVFLFDLDDTYELACPENGDVNGDGLVDLDDAFDIFLYDLGVLDGFTAA